MSEEKRELAIVSLRGSLTFVGIVSSFNFCNMIVLDNAVSVWFPQKAGEQLHLTDMHLPMGMCNIIEKNKQVMFPIDHVEFMTVIPADSDKDLICEMYKDMFSVREIQEPSLPYDELTQ